MLAVDDDDDTDDPPNDDDAIDSGSGPGGRGDVDDDSSRTIRALLRAPAFAHAVHSSDHAKSVCTDCVVGGAAAVAAAVAFSRFDGRVRSATRVGTTALV